MPGYCGRCKNYRLYGDNCSCEVRGRAWCPELGESEDDGEEVWSIMSRPDDAVPDWFEHRHGDDCEWMSDDGDCTDVMFRQSDGKLFKVNVTTSFTKNFSAYESEEVEPETEETTV